MSSTDLLKLSIEARRKYQHESMKRWSKGLTTGRECIEEVLALENVIYLDDNVLKEYRKKHEGSESTPTKT